MRALNLTGDRFGRLVAISVAPRVEGQNRPVWICKCDCGNEVLLIANRLTSGNTTSCGCFRADEARRRRTRHGHTSTHGASLEYMVWAGMIQRCTNPSHASYQQYGGRGISVHERWSDFRNFIADMGERPTSKHSIDRINNDGNYEPSNCRWATPAEQMSNRSDNRIVEFGGIKKPLSHWARDLGITHSSLAERIDSGRWSLQDALTVGNCKNQKITHNGLTMSRKEWAKYLGVAHSTITQRTRLLPIAEALDPAKIRKRSSKN